MYQIKVIKKEKVEINLKIPDKIVICRNKVYKNLIILKINKKISKSVNLFNV
jgi:hypothetical protein